MAQAMTLRKLAQRLNDIVAENERRGWGNRNDLPAGIEVVRYTPKGKTRNTYYTVNYVSSAQHGMGNGVQLCGVLNTTEKDNVNKQDEAEAIELKTGNGKCVCPSAFKAAKECPVHGW